MRRIGRNPLKSGQCFLLRSGKVYEVWVESQSPQIGSMFLTKREEKMAELKLIVAIPSNRVNVSYLKKGRKETKFCGDLPVAIPSNRVNVSYYC